VPSEHERQGDAVSQHAEIGGDGYVAARDIVFNLSPRLRSGNADREAAYSRLLARLPQPAFDEVDWTPFGSRFWRALGAAQFKPERPAYSRVEVSSVLGHIKELLDGKVDEGSYGYVTRTRIMPTHERIDKIAAFLASLRLRVVEPGNYDNFQRSNGLYSVESVDRYLAEYRKCLAEYFEERERA
jgi:hypothetical protein